MQTYILRNKDFVTDVNYWYVLGSETIRHI
jgi:hypothetical protein